MRALILATLLLGPAMHAFGFEADDSTARRIRIAGEVVTDRMESSLAVPKYVLDQTKCVASLKVMKVGLIWGGAGSTGLVSCKTQGEWSAPAFLNIGGVNFGLQIGVQFIESVVTFMTDSSREILDRPSFKVGVDLSFAAGPVGQGTGAGFTPQAALLTYDKTFGLYIGATIDGFVLSQGVERNQEIYGDGVTTHQILGTPGKAAPKEVQSFIAILNKYMPN